jgi:serine/threonine-protein kinase
MSPEQGKGAVPDARSDLYSLGVVLFEMLAGQRPFPGDSHWALVHQHVSVPAPALSRARPGVSRAAERVVARCLEKDPARRFQTAGELAAALDRALAEEGTAGTLTPSGQYASRPEGLFETRAGKVRTVEGQPVGRRWLPFGLVGLVGLAALILAGWLIFSRDGNNPPITATPGLPVGVVATPAVTTIIREVTSAAPTSTSQPTANAQPPTGIAPLVETVIIEVTATAPADTPTTEPAGGVVTARTTRNVRTRGGPGTAYPETGFLSPSEVVEVLGRFGEWFVVQTEGESAVWVSATYLLAESGALTDVTPAATIPALPATATRPPSVATAVPPTSPPTEDGATSPPPPPPTVEQPTDQPPTATLAPEPTNTLAP